jgi:hypothetical protein
VFDQVARFFNVFPLYDQFALLADVPEDQTGESRRSGDDGQVHQEHPEAASHM